MRVCESPVATDTAAAEPPEVGQIRKRMKKIEKNKLMSLKEPLAEEEQRSVGGWRLCCCP